MERNLVAQALFDLLLFISPAPHVVAVFVESTFGNLAPVFTKDHRVIVSNADDRGLFNIIQLFPEASFFLCPELVVALVSAGEHRLQFHVDGNRIFWIKLFRLFGFDLSFSETPLLVESVVVINERREFLLNAVFRSLLRSDLRLDFFITTLQVDDRSSLGHVAVDRCSAAAKLANHWGDLLSIESGVLQFGHHSVEDFDTLVGTLLFQRVGSQNGVLNFRS